MAKYSKKMQKRIDDIKSKKEHRAYMEEKKEKDAIVKAKKEEDMRRKLEAMTSEERTEFYRKKKAEAQEVFELMSKFWMENKILRKR